MISHMGLSRGSVEQWLEAWLLESGCLHSNSSPLLLTNRVTLDKLLKLVPISSSIKVHTVNRRYLQVLYLQIGLAKIYLQFPDQLMVLWWSFLNALRTVENLNWCQTRPHSACLFQPHVSDASRTETGRAVQEALAMESQSCHLLVARPRASHSFEPPFISCKI